MSQFELPKLKPGNGNHKTKELFSLYYAKEQKDGNSKTQQKKIAVSSDEGLLLSIINRRTSMALPRNFVLPKVESVSRIRVRRKPNKAAQDKHGIICSLDRLDVTNVARNSSIPASLTERSPTLSTDMKYHHGEVSRQIELSTVSLRMKKEADIHNYQLADNDVSKQQLDIIKACTTLPKVNSKKIT